MGAILESAGSSFANGRRLEFLKRLIKLTKILLIVHVVHLFFKFLMCFFYLFLVVETTILLADINDYKAVNDVYATCKPRNILPCNLVYF